MAPVEIGHFILFSGVIGGQKRGGPTISAEYLVSALAALDHPDPLGYFLRQQVKSHRVVADHGLGHRADRCGKHLQGSISVYSDLLVVGGEVLCNQVRVLKLISGMLPDTLKSD